jgi:endonuclease/exonuclease/phosphatase family metal-dependent hydrolase
LVIQEKDQQRNFRATTHIRPNRHDRYLQSIHSTTRQYTFFSAPHGTFSKIDHILGHKASLNKFKKIEITPGIISDHNGIKLDLNNKRNHRKYSNTWRLNNTLLKGE